MIGIFKQKNPANTLLLLVYGLILKFGLFLHPQYPLKQEGDHFLYTWIIDFFSRMGLHSVFFSLFTFLLYYVQAILFNRICNAQKMLAKTTYLPGMSFLLITSLLVEWNRFSAPLLVNTLMVWVFYRMVVMYNAPKSGSAIFNIGLLLGIVSLLYKPALPLSLLVFFTLYIMRAFRMQEWLIGLLGITTPYYFLAILLYLGNQWNWSYLKPSIDFSFPGIPSSVFITISITLLVIPFIIGGFFVQNNLNKMLIQVRKAWSLVLIYLIIGITIIMINGGNDYSNWLLCAIPLAAFHSAAYFYPLNQTFSSVMHYIGFAYALYVNYWL
ncbi:MAG TPA: DUF6427 family protein [Flavitalea sp.]|nr:DUF6427 family protein [Flavitalea sp.]